MHVMTTQMLYGRFSDNPELKHPGGMCLLRWWGVGVAVVMSLHPCYKLACHSSLCARSS